MHKDYHWFIASTQIRKTICILKINILKIKVKIKEEGKDQESIQSSTTPDPRHHMGK